MQADIKFGDSDVVKHIPAEKNDKPLIYYSNIFRAKYLWGKT